MTSPPLALLQMTNLAEAVGAADEFFVFLNVFGRKSPKDDGRKQQNTPKIRHHAEAIGDKQEDLIEDGPDGDAAEEVAGLRELELHRTVAEQKDGEQVDRPGDGHGDKGRDKLNDVEGSVAEVGAGFEGDGGFGVGQVETEGAEGAQGSEGEKDGLNALDHGAKLGLMLR